VWWTATVRAGWPACRRPAGTPAPPSPPAAGTRSAASRTPPPPAPWSACAAPATSGTPMLHATYVRHSLGQTLYTFFYYFYLLALVETAVSFSLVMHSVTLFAPCPASCFRTAGLAVYFFRIETFSQSKCVYSITCTLPVAYHVILQFLC
jgi:hypothetical protein